MVERLASGLAVAVAGLLVTASVALAQFADRDSASQSLSTNTLHPPTGPATAHGPCTNGVTASIVVSWTPTPSSWADGYEVLGSLVSGGPYTTMGNADGAGTAGYTVTGLAFATTYHFVVKAAKGNWRSTATPQVSRTTLSPLCL
jgi:hypothetical protein